MAEVALALVEPQLPDRDAGGKRTGNRYTPAQREGAFTLWAALDPPCYAVTASALGIAEKTIRLWAKADDWPGRYRALTGDDPTGVTGRLSAARRVDAVADRMLRQLDLLSMVALVQTLSDPKARDRVRAAELALGLNGRVVPKVGITQRVPYGEGQVLSAADLAQLDPDALLALAAARLSPPALDVTDVTPEPQPE